METIPFVKKEHASIARDMEAKMLALPKGSGVLFVGVDVTPTDLEEDPIYSLLLGIDRELLVDRAVRHLVSLSLSNEIMAGANIQIEVRRGRARG